MIATLIDCEGRQQPGTPFGMPLWIEDDVVIDSSTDAIEASETLVQPGVSELTIEISYRLIRR